MASTVVHGTLVADTVATETLDADYDEVWVLNRGTTPGDDDIWVRTDGEDPDVDTDGSYFVPPGTQRPVPVHVAGTTVVTLYCEAGTPKYEVSA